MSMALSLEYGVEWLKTKHGFKNNECGVQFNCEPPYDAGPHYIGLDDGGIEAGPENTNSLRETLNWNVGIWRRPEHLVQKDRTARLQLPRDKYLLGAYTIYDLERQIIVPRLNGFHHNFDFMNGLNERYNLPHAEFGDKFFLPMFYKGRSKMQQIAVESPNMNQTEPIIWYGYILKFRGLVREQRLTSTYATG